MTTLLDVDIDEVRVRELLGKILSDLASETPGYPVAVEADGSRWVSLDWVLEKLGELRK